MLYGSSNDYVWVHNLNGTSDNTPPKPYQTWKDFWQGKTGRRFTSCSCKGCGAPAEVGAHVQKSGDDYHWYIVPLCRSCNNKSSDDEFQVKRNNLVRVTD